MVTCDTNNKPFFVTNKNISKKCLKQLFQSIFEKWQFSTNCDQIIVHRLPNFT